MKTLRRILFSLLIIVVILLVTGYFLPRKIYLERSMQMNAPVETIFNQVNSMQNWSRWSPWLVMDSSVRIVCSGPDSGVGSGFSYKSDQDPSNKGKLTISCSVPYDSILIDMDFLDKGKAISKFLFKSLEKGTRVTWIMESDLGNDPISRWFGLFTDKMVGTDFEKGLFGINELTTAFPGFPTVFVSETYIPAVIALTMMDTASTHTIPSKLSSCYSLIAQEIRREKLSVTGPPFAIYHNVTTRSCEIEAGIPVNRKANLQGDVRCNEFPSRKAIMATHFGHYENTSKVYEAMDRYIRSMKLIRAGSPMEVYISDPSSEPDTNKWQTNIFIPIHKTTPPLSYN